MRILVIFIFLALISQFLTEWRIITNIKLRKSRKTKQNQLWYVQWDYHFCNKCYGLFYYGEQGNLNPGNCPAGGSHNAGTSNYGLVQQSQKGNNQPFWKQCEKCRGLFQCGDKWTYRAGVCPSGGRHATPDEWSVYIPMQKYENDQYAPKQQENWRFCPKCSGLFWSGTPGFPGICPAGGGHFVPIFGGTTEYFPFIVEKK